MLTCLVHMRPHICASSFMCASSGDCVLICAPVALTFLMAAATASVESSLRWLKWDMNARCSPLSVMRLNTSSISSASGSVRNLYGQYASAFVPILTVLRCGSLDSIMASAYFANMRAFIIIGSPPVNRMSVISGCSDTYWTSCSPSFIANFISSIPTNCGHLKQKLQYAWQVWLWLGKKRQVSLYLCCMPYSFVPSLSAGTLSSICPAGCGLSCRRISFATRAISSLPAPPSSAASIFA